MINIAIGSQAELLRAKRKSGRQLKRSIPSSWVYHPDSGEVEATSTEDSSLLLATLKGRKATSHPSLRDRRRTYVESECVEQIMKVLSARTTVQDQECVAELREVQPPTAVVSQEYTISEARMLK